MTKCPKLFAWMEGTTLPRLNEIFKTMKECGSEKLYLLERDEEEIDDGYIDIIVGAKSRAEAVDYVCDIEECDNDEDCKSVEKRVKLWDDDLTGGYVIGKANKISDFFPKNYKKREKIKKIKKKKIEKKKKKKKFMRAR